MAEMLARRDWIFAAPWTALVVKDPQRQPAFRSRTQVMLTDGYVQLEDYESAIGALSKFVDQHPDRPGARAVGAVARIPERATKVTRIDPAAFVIGNSLSSAASSIIAATSSS
jgi:hypothetical protein